MASSSSLKSLNVGSGGAFSNILEDLIIDIYGPLVALSSFDCLLKSSFPHSSLVYKWSNDLNGSPKALSAWFNCFDACCVCFLRFN